PVLGVAGSQRKGDVRADRVLLVAVVPGDEGAHDAQAQRPELVAHAHASLIIGPGRGVRAVGGEGRGEVQGVGQIDGGVGLRAAVVVRAEGLVRADADRGGGGGGESGGGGQNGQEVHGLFHSS